PSPICGPAIHLNQCLGAKECKDQCCDAATCKLKPGAQCAEGECCSNCKIKAAGEVCRERNDDDCDLEDVCDGKSPWCWKHLHTL
uniref:Disintegrin domain-containing protein n=1 Tax=Xenopus tropicalis TaxID=8364 RepID=A0A6I8Q8H6_XENTR